METCHLEWEAVKTCLGEPCATVAAPVRATAAVKFGSGHGLETEEVCGAIRPVHQHKRGQAIPQVEDVLLHCVLERVSMQMISPRQPRLQCILHTAYILHTAHRTRESYMCSPHVEPHGRLSQSKCWRQPLRLSLEGYGGSHK
jgi:hypothetical protein